MDNIANKLLLIIITLLFMFGALLLTIYSWSLVQQQSLVLLLESFYGKLEPGILFFVLFLAGAWALYPFFLKSKKKKTTVLNQTNFGEVDITLEALENLVKGVAIQQEDIEDIRTELIPTEEGIVIYLTGKVYPSTVIPELTEELQKVTKSYIEDTTGVSVQEVRILIDDIYEESEDEEKYQKRQRSESKDQDSREE